MPGTLAGTLGGVQTPDEIRRLLSQWQEGETLGVDARAVGHISGTFISFDGETLRMQPGLPDPDGEAISIAFDAIQRVVIEITSAGPE